MDSTVINNIADSNLTDLPPLSNIFQTNPSQIPLPPISNLFNLNASLLTEISEAVGNQQLTPPPTASPFTFTETSNSTSISTPNTPYIIILIY